MFSVDSERGLVVEGHAIQAVRGSTWRERDGVEGLGAVEQLQSLPSTLALYGPDTVAACRSLR